MGKEDKKFCKKRTSRSAWQTGITVQVNPEGNRPYIINMPAALAMRTHTHTHTHTRTHTHLGRPAKQWVLCAAALHHVPDEVLLSVVGGQDGDLFGRVAHETHEAEDGHHHLGLTQILGSVCEGPACEVNKWLWKQRGMDIDFNLCGHERAQQGSVWDARMLRWMRAQDAIHMVYILTSHGVTQLFLGCVLKGAGKLAALISGRNRPLAKDGHALARNHTQPAHEKA
eukprot:1157388-Pelagomonas_calceolata.AAC.2